ncbi:uncharacterized protein LOC119730816 [Patiria miniata]|uniref:DUF5077 domain-containing protein n=1 Tax=Patiria miniata TaxID=46514 RepID=A0A914A7L5_PATMI|nr:uncharacterized protein LOC119730816 [Patiria miniata]
MANHQAAARSVHLRYDLPDNVPCVCNEVCVDETRKGSYFCVIGFSRGYCGIQELSDGQKKLIFSVWDSESNNDPTPENRVKVTYSGEGVEVSRFGNEGTGGKTMMPFDWKIEVPVKFKMEARDEDGVWTSFSCFVFIETSSSWFHIATLKTIANGDLLKSVYSFVEDFRRDFKSYEETRMAKFGDCFALNGDCETECRRAMFTADGSPCKNIDAGCLDTKFFLETGGQTQNTHTPLNGYITL